MMTAREAHISIKNISKRLKDNFILQARIHGVEIKGSNEVPKMSEETIKKFDKIIDKLDKERFEDGKQL